MIALTFRDRTLRSFLSTSTPTTDPSPQGEGESVTLAAARASGSGTFWLFAAAPFLLTLHTPAAQAASWTLVPSESRIGFSGTHAGRPFKGAFKTFAAKIEFDPADLTSSKAEVTIDLASAATGDATYDRTLPTSDWFDLTKTPKGVFSTGAFKAIGGDRYEAQGEVELRGAKAPVTFAFAAKIEGETLRVTGTATLKRLDFGVGKSSDASGAWVSLDIPVDVSVVAKRG